MTTQILPVDLHAYLALAAFLTHTSPIRAAAMMDSMSDAAQHACLAALCTPALWPDVTALTRSMTTPEAETLPLHDAALMVHAACILEHQRADAVDVVRDMADTYPAQAKALLRHLATLDMLWEQEDACIAEILPTLPPHKLALVLLAEEEALRQRILALCGERRAAVEKALREAVEDPFTERELPLLLPRQRQQLLRALRMTGSSLRWQPERLFTPRYHPCPNLQEERAIAGQISDEELLLRLRNIPAQSLALIAYSLCEEARKRLLSLCSPRMQETLEQDMADFPRITVGMVAEAWKAWDAEPQACPDLDGLLADL